MNKSSEVIQLTISEEDIANFKRLDQFLAKSFPELSRSLIKKLYEDGHIQADTKLELKKMPKVGTEISFTPPTFNETDLIPENIPLEILYEDDHLIIINKAAGMVVHPAPGNYTGTLVHAVLYHCPSLEGIGNEKRPGIVHRLDKGTSGIMVVAKNQKTHEGLVKLFSTHDINRKYQAIALGVKIPQTDHIKTMIGRNPHNRLKMSTKVKHGKEAITHVKVLEYFQNFSHVELKLETGRTHQIRVHLCEVLNSPILNDEMYGRQRDEQRVMPSKLKALLKDYEFPFLHAKTLGFKHPITGEYLEFNQEPPMIFQETLKVLKEDAENI
jgi:23S rRNA pseudouridine1911/1915/1917 synthase